MRRCCFTQRRNLSSAFRTFSTPSCSSCRSSPTSKNSNMLISSNFSFISNTNNNNNSSSSFSTCSNHALVSSIRHQSSSSSSSSSSSTADFKMPTFQAGPGSEFPIVQLPAKSLWCIHDEISLADIKTHDFRTMLQRLKDTRHHYQYPSLSAPQIGWNVSVFVLHDGSVWINPKIKKLYESETCWSWEPCASCCFLMHFIERPHECVVSRYDENGKYHEGDRLDGMKSRLVQHEMDHLTGILFSRRIPNSLHVVPMDGFYGMSDWAEDYPSIEARSTNLYTLFFPPYKFQSNYLKDSELLKRHYEDNIFPGHEVITQASEEEGKNNAALQEFIEEQKKAGLWKGSQFSHNRRRT